MPPQTAEGPIAISLVEDDATTRDDLVDVFRREPRLDLVSVHPTAEDALDHLPFGRVRVVLLDIVLPGMSGIDAARELQSADPDLLILMLTAHEDSTRLFESLRAGASGYILKRDPPEEIVRDIFSAAAGGAPMSPAIARKVIHHFRTAPAAPKTPTPAADADGQLTPRESQILGHLAAGYGYKEIAVQLDISDDTVRTHLKRVYRKLHVHSGPAAVAKWMRRER